MNALLQRRRDKGNTVLVVEHDTDVITAADHVVELGPRAGGECGRIVYEGDVAGLATSGTLTGESCAGRSRCGRSRGVASSYLRELAASD